MKHNHKRSEEVQLHIRAVIQELQSLQQMIGNEYSCVVVVQRLTSIISRVSDCRAIVARDHVSTCLQTLEGGEVNKNALSEVEQLLQIFLKNSLSSGSHH